jgi:phosphatidylglycerophosphatase A
MTERAPLPPGFWRNPVHWLAFGFGSGAVPVAPGTAGTLAAVPIYLLLAALDPWLYLLLTLALLLLGVWLCGVTARHLGVHDHGGIVWDEMVGFLLTMSALPPRWDTLLLGFVLFRLFDIAKPWPIRWADRRVPGGLGIMLDDVLAAAYAAFALHLLLPVLP